MMAAHGTHDEPGAGTGRPAGERGRVWHCGQTLPIVALMLVALVAFLALVLDLGNAYAQRRFMQGAADAAALAGARALALEKPASEIDAVIDEYAKTRNGAHSYAADVSTRTVTVVVSKTFPTFFAGVIGQPTMTAAAVAVAEYTFPGPWKGDLMPIALHESARDLDGPIQIWDDEVVSDFDAGIVGNGHRGFLSFEGSGNTDDLRPWIQYGYDGEVYTDTYVNGMPGLKQPGLQDMATYQLGEVIFVPIYDVLCDHRVSDCEDIGNGQINYHIIGFGALTVTDVVSRGNPKYIVAEWVDKYVVPQRGGGGEDFGVRVVRLVR